MTSLSGIEANLCFQTKTSRLLGRCHPDAQILFVSLNLASDRGKIFKKSLFVSNEDYSKSWKQMECKNVLTLAPVLLQTESYGKLYLRSPNPKDEPRLFGNFLADRKDTLALLDALRMGQELMKSPAFRKYQPKLQKIPLPNCDKYEFDSDDYWICAFKYQSFVIGNPYAACKMGREGDSTAVVNSDGLVYGFWNLRVVDESIFPIPMTGLTSFGPCAMAGEKIADVIKRKYAKIPKIIW